MVQYKNEGEEFIPAKGNKINILPPIKLGKVDIVIKWGRIYNIPQPNSFSCFVR